MTQPRKRKAYNCDMNIFRQVVELRTQGTSWSKINTILNRSGITSQVGYFGNKTFTGPDWIQPKLSDQIIIALRAGTKPPGTPKEIRQVRFRAIDQGLLEP